MILHHHHFNYNEPLGRDVHYLHYFVTLYADDILLYIQNPEKSLRELIKLINDYSNILDYSINWNKSVIFLLNKTLNSAKIKNNQFKIGNITYLEIQFSSNIRSVYS